MGGGSFHWSSREPQPLLVWRMQLVLLQLIAVGQLIATVPTKHVAWDAEICELLTNSVDMLTCQL